MGEKLTEQLGQSERPVDTKPNPGKPTTGNSGTGTTGKGTGGTGNDSATAGTGKPSAGTGETEKEKVPGLASLIQNQETPPAPAKPKKAAKRKPSKKKKAEPETSFSADQLSALILSMSAIVGSRPGMEIWTLQPEEAKQLATPISNMVAKSDKLSQLSEHADAVALVSASLVIFAPRALVYYDMQKQKKIKANGGVQLVNKKPENPGNNAGASKPRATNGQEYGGGVLDSIPAFA